VLLARLPLLHPEGLHPEWGLGPATRCAGRPSCTPLVKRRSTSLARLDALLEILGPTWHAGFGADLSSKTVLRFLAAGYADPHTVRRLGRARLTRFLHRHSRGTYGQPMAEQLLAAAIASTELWEEELSYPDLAEDMGLEARLALALTEEIHELDERITVLVDDLDPHSIITSTPGVGAVTGAVILGRLADADRFHSLAAVRAYTGLVPALDASGTSGRHGGPTKRGDALLCEALFMAASQARRHDPTLAAKYHRLMVVAGKHHTSATCHIATTLITRVVACWRNTTPYQLRDTDGTPITATKARAIIAEKCTVPEDIRHARTTNRRTTDEPAKQGVAKRSINRPVHHQR
jgi:Transposase IS116/IS110/IS902 family